MKDKLIRLKEKILRNKTLTFCYILLFLGVILIFWDCNPEFLPDRIVLHCNDVLSTLGLGLMITSALIGFISVLYIGIRYWITDRRFKFIERGLCPFCKGTLETELIAYPYSIVLESKEKREYFACYNCNKTFSTIEGI